MEGQQDREYENSHYQRVPQMVPVTRPRPNEEGTVIYNQRRHQAASPTSQPDLDAADQSQAAGSYGYAQGHQFSPQMQDQTLQYPNEFGSDGTRQQFQSYPQNLLYNLVSQASQSTDYEPVPQFNPRQSAAIEVLSNQFSVSPYYPPGEPTSRASQSSQNYSTSSYQPATQFSQRTSVTHSSTSPRYISGVADYSPPGRSGIMQVADRPSSQRSGDETFPEFYDSLRQVFGSIQHGDLLQAGHQLLQLSEWVSGHAVEIGLTRDDQVPQEQRLDFWNNFNTCWLALLQKQKDSSQEMLDHGQPPPSGQTILQEDMLERMARELVRMCDGMERHGLVDYQMGIWEEEIMNVLLECLQLLEGDMDEYGASDLPVPRMVPPESSGRSK